MTCRESIETFVQCPVVQYCESRQLIADEAKAYLYDNGGIFPYTLELLDAAEFKIDLSEDDIEKQDELRVLAANLRQSMQVAAFVADELQVPRFEVERVRHACLSEPHITDLGSVACSSLAINEEDRTEITLLKEL